MMHFILLAQIDQAIYIDQNKDLIAQTFLNKQNYGVLGFNEEQIYINEFNYWKWIDYIYAFEQRAMLITFLMYATWMFTFMHIFEAVYAAKNKRVAKFVLFENVLDFWIMIMGMIYIAIVYKVYRWDTFVSGPS